MTTFLFYLKQIKIQLLKSELKMKSASIIFPNQLFKNNPLIKNNKEIFLVEDKKYFTDFKFHKKKLLLHRASMQYYKDFLKQKGLKINYINFNQNLFDTLKQSKIELISFIDPVDHELNKRLFSESQKYNIKIEKLTNSSFLTPEKHFNEFFKGKEHFSMTSFYIDQRKRLKILVDSKGKASGGKWSFDPENRQRMPKNTPIPKITKYGKNEYVEKAKIYVEKNFPDNYGKTEGFFYPVMHTGAEQWLEEFLNDRLENFGTYEDFITEKDSILFHSCLSFALNNGLLTPNYVIKTTLEHAGKNKTSLNSLEGYIRQVIGWREFTKGVYSIKGEFQRSSNYWNHQNPVPKCFYNATTGILPLDNAIKKVLDNAYNHHIERLMVLGNFMLLCEISPHEVYKWFMELYIDSYDWVMTPNVYGMSMFADGGLMMTKPYLSSSNYIKKMSDFPEDDWCQVWDGLYWRFIAKHIGFFEKIQD